MRLHFWTKYPQVKLCNLTVRDWYRILRQYHHYSVLQAVYYALYLRGVI